MKTAAIGARMHSGWGALVAVSNSAGTIEVIDRRRIAVTPPGTPGVNHALSFRRESCAPGSREIHWQLFCRFERPCPCSRPRCDKQTARTPISCRGLRSPAGFRASAASTCEDPSLPRSDTCCGRRILSRCLFKGLPESHCFGHRISRAGSRWVFSCRFRENSFADEATNFNAWQVSRTALDYRSKDCCTRCITGPGKQTKIIPDGSAREAPEHTRRRDKQQYLANLQSTVPTLRTRAPGSPR